MDTKEIAACMGEIMSLMMTMIIFMMTMMMTIIMMTLVMTNRVTKIMIMSISMTWTPRRLPPAWVR